MQDQESSEPILNLASEKPGGEGHDETNHRPHHRWTHDAQSGYLSSSLSRQRAAWRRRRSRGGPGFTGPPGGGFTGPRGGGFTELSRRLSGGYEGPALNRTPFFNMRRTYAEAFGHRVRKRQPNRTTASGNMRTRSIMQM